MQEGNKYFISVCPPDGYLKYEGMASTWMSMKNKDDQVFASIKPQLSLKFISRQFQVNQVLNSSPDSAYTTKYK